MLLPSLLALNLLAAPAAGPFMPPEAECPLPVGMATDALRPDFGKALDLSLAYLKGPSTAKAYAGHGTFTQARVRRTLERFQELTRPPVDPLALGRALLEEFEFHPAAGRDGSGSMLFTGYYEAVFDASRTPDAQYRFPLYGRPKDLASWPRPHPGRRALEGLDGLQGAKGPLKGLELVWLKDRLEAFLVHVQGSARLRLPDGETLSVGYAGATEHPYVSLGRELIQAGKLKGEDLNLPNMVAFFKAHPEDLGPFLTRCDRFIFFHDTQGSPAKGGLGIPVTAECTVAADKGLFPPGGLALIELDMPFPRPDGTLETRKVRRFVLDQDSGKAIQGPGRMDVFMGTGEEAGNRAGHMSAPGRAWYLLLKEPPPAVRKPAPR